MILEIYNETTKKENITEKGKKPVDKPKEDKNVVLNKKTEKKKKKNCC